MALKAVTAAACAAAVVVASGCTSDDGNGDRPKTPPAAASLPSDELVAQAVAAGLTTRVPRAVVRTCAEVAARAARQANPRLVFCPPLVPDVEIAVDLAGGLLQSARFADGYMIGFWSPEFPRATDFGGHWTISAGTESAQRVYLYPPDPRARPPRVSKTMLGGIAVTILAVPPPAPGFYSGHSSSRGSSARRPST